MMSNALEMAENAPNLEVKMETYITVCQFLAHEARLLDEGNFEAWYSLLDPGISYEIPVRLAVKRGSSNEFPRNAYRIKDDFAMIGKRVQRATTGEDWSEAPPSRTVRSVSSIEVEPSSDSEVFLVHSAVLVYRERALEENWDIIPARRTDQIRVRNGQCTLMNRRVILAERSVKTPNLGIFI